MMEWREEEWDLKRWKRRENFRSEILMLCSKMMFKFIVNLHFPQVYGQFASAVKVEAKKKSGKAMPSTYFFHLVDCHSRGAIAHPQPFTLPSEGCDSWRSIVIGSYRLRSR